MYFATLHLSLLEIAILQGGALVLGITIYFFISSRRSLKKTIGVQRELAGLAAKKATLPATIGKLQEPKPAKVPATPPAIPAFKKQPAEALATASFNPQSVHLLKDSLLQQKQTLQQLLEKMADLEESAVDRDALKAENDELQERIEQLQLELHQKEAEVKKAKQQEAVAQQMAARIDEVYREFELLQQKMNSLERQAGRSNALTLELEDLQQAYNGLQKELTRKQEKLEEMVAENGRLHQNLSVTEDKLAEANLQRQQLMKRTQFLQDVNSDMQHMTESNQKLQKELRRIGELESMLNLMADEKSQFFRPQKNRE